MEFKSVAGAIVSIGWLFIGYFLLATIVIKTTGLIGGVASGLKNASQGVTNGLANGRKKRMSDRGQDFKEGSLYRDNRLTRPINGLGTRIGAAQAGAGYHAFLGTTRGRKARALYGAQLGEARLKRSPLLQEAANEDPANAVLGLSGGSEQGLREAARDIFTDDEGVYDEALANDAMSSARAIGVNRGNAAAALKTTMASKARAISAGNVRAVDRGVRRLARNREEYASLGEQTAAVARASGRADLGGRSVVDSGNGYNRTGKSWELAKMGADAVMAQNPNMSREMAEYQVLADSNMMDGFDRTNTHAMMAGHGNQAIQVMQTMARTLRIRNIADTGGADLERDEQVATANRQIEQNRVQAAMAIKEMQGALPSASAGVRDSINLVLYSKHGTDKSRGEVRNGLNLNPELGIAAQLATMTGRRGLTAQGLTTMARTYPEASGDPSGRGQGSPPDET